MVGDERSNCRADRRSDRPAGVAGRGIACDDRDRSFSRWDPGRRTLSPTSPGPRKRGKNYFYGGPDSTRSTGSQTITVAGSGVSTGKVTYKLSGWLGGYDSQGDRAVLQASFETADGSVLSTASIGPVSMTARHDTSELRRRATSGMVPAATRKVALTLVMSRGSGSDNDGLADDLSLVFTA